MNFAKHVKFRDEKFGSVVFETLSEKVYVTNETGRDILKLIREGEDTENIVKNLCDLYEGNNARINNEATMFINQLKEKELITE